MAQWRTYCQKMLQRRQFLAGAALGIAGGAVGGVAWRAGQPHEASLLSPIAGQPGALGLPGPYPGRVIEVNHPGSVKEGKRDREAIREMLARGMQELVQGSTHPLEAWRHFFQRGDRVGIKVVPVGQPLSISSFEVVQEVIRSLCDAGVRANDIMVFERYRSEFLRVGYADILPDSVHWECSSADYDEAQLEIDGQLPKQPKVKNVAGYDRDVYRELAYCMPEPSHDPADDRRYRSHLSTIITQKIDKFISIPVLKDHRSAGVTLCLKNLSHGSVNNVARSHGNANLNQCGEFIPAIVSLPQIREKAVLQILDGLIGTYEGGPGNWNSTFATWEYKSLFFATDPVAMDRIGWAIIDRKRAQEGWPSVARMGVDGEHRLLPASGGRTVPSEQFSIRQPQHIAIAGTLGLGQFDREKIHYRRIEWA